MRTYLFNIIILFVTTALFAQFGGNKIQYFKKHWKCIQSTHFDIYYAENSREIGAFAAGHLEKALDSITNDIRYRIKKRIPVIIYKSQSDFEETNVILDEIGEGTGGFTEIFKSRIVVPFAGSYLDFSHVLHHELTHAVMYDLIFENVFNAFRYKASFQIPLWVAEGWAEYESAHWNLESDMYLMDAVISGYIAEPRDEFGTPYLAYKAGMAFYNYLVRQYGRECVGDFIKGISLTKNVDKAFLLATHTTLKRAGEFFLLDTKKKYWPELGRRDNASEIARKLTEHRAAGYFTVRQEQDPLSNFNIQPSVSPDGKTIAYFSDREDYTGIYLMDARTGRRLGKLAESGSSDEFESFHSYKSGIAWSGDGTRLLFTAKSSGQDVIRVMDVKKGKVVETLPVRMDRIEYPAWSSDNEWVVFSGLVSAQSDIYLYNMKTRETRKLTSDESYDTHPVFSSDNTKILFESEYGRGLGCNGTNLFLMDRDGTHLRRLTDSPFDNTTARFSSDDKLIYFISNRSGISNLYVMNVDTLVPHPVTNVFAGCFNPSLPKSNAFVVFSVFENGGWDIYRMEEPLKHVRQGELPLTDYVRSLTDTSFAFWRKQEIPPAASDTGQNDSARNAKAFRDSVRHDSLASDSLNNDDLETAFEDDPYRNPFDPFGDRDMFGPDYTEKRPRKKHREPPPDTSAFLHDTTRFKNRNGSYREYDYTPQFSFDAISAVVGGVAGPNSFALGGQTAFALSDVLGNHQIFVAANLYSNSLQNPFDALNGYLAYYYLPFRTDFGLTLSRYINIFGAEDAEQLNYDIYLDAVHNGNFEVWYPFSKFLRTEASAGFTYISRTTEHWQRGEITEDYQQAWRKKTESILNTEFGAAAVFDNSLWGMTGPVNGGRVRVSGQLAPKSADSDFGYGVGLLDARRYFHFLKKYVIALRFSAGASEPLFSGQNPKLFYLGGVPDNIAYLFTPYFLDNSLESNYYSSIVMPLRGYTLGAANPKGNTQFALANMEFRFPFIQDITLYFPLPISIQYIMGALFFDVGGAWDKPEQFRPFRPGNNSPFGFQDLKGGAGFGLRLNVFNAMVLKWDRAWKVGRESGREDYISLGAEF